MTPFSFDRHLHGFLSRRVTAGRHYTLYDLLGILTDERYAYAMDAHSLHNRLRMMPDVAYHGRILMPPDGVARAKRNVAVFSFRGAGHAAQ